MTDRDGFGDSFVLRPSYSELVTICPSDRRSHTCQYESVDRAVLGLIEHDRLTPTSPAVLPYHRR